MKIKNLIAGFWYRSKIEYIDGLPTLKMYRYSGRKEENGNPIFYQIIALDNSSPCGFRTEEVVFNEEECRHLLQTGGYMTLEDWESYCEK